MPGQQQGSREPTSEEGSGGGQSLAFGAPTQAYMRNLFTDPFCKTPLMEASPRGNQPFADDTPHRQTYYGWISNPAADVNCCVPAAEYTSHPDGKFCLLYSTNVKSDGIDLKPWTKRCCVYNVRDAEGLTEGLLSDNMERCLQRVSKERDKPPDVRLDERGDAGRRSAPLA